MTLIQMRRSITSGSVPPSVSPGEMVLNLADKILYTCDQNGNVIATALTGIAPLASPAFTGTPTTTTSPASTDNSQTLAPTSWIRTFVASLLSSVAPLMDTASAATGTSTSFARADHVHPTDTSRAKAGANADITSLSALTTPLSVSQGGTGATSLYRNGLKNRLTNGAFAVDQRNSGAAVTIGTAPAWSADRWFGFTGSSPSGQTAQRVFYGTGNVAFALRLNRSSGSAATAPMYAGQVLESYPNIDLQGQPVTLSFKARAGANFSGSGLAASIVTGTGTDQGATAFTGGTWSGYAVAASATQPLTTAWQTFVLQATIPAGATQVGVSLGYAPTGTAGSADYADVTDVQLEIGAFAPAQVTFERRPQASEIALCQRYYEVVASVWVGDATAGSNYTALVPYAVDKRVAGVTFASISQAGAANGTMGTRTAVAVSVRAMSAYSSPTSTGAARGWNDAWGVSAEMN